MKRTALIVAGGTGIRMGSQIPKQFLPLAGKPVLVHTLEAFLRFDPGLLISLVLHPDAFPYWEDHAGKYLSTADRSRIITCEGGQERSSSVYQGLLSLWDHPSVSSDCLVAIHDGVRPLVSQDLIDRSYREAALHGASVACNPIPFSIRQKRGDFSKSVDRRDFFEVQTPQVFHLHDILECYNKRPHNDFTDDASLFEALGHEVAICKGDSVNLKITTPGDLYVAEQMLRNRR